MTELATLIRLFLLFILGFLFLLILFCVHVGWFIFTMPTRWLERGKKRGEKWSS